jgi:hypothetical protein
MVRPERRLEPSECLPHHRLGLDRAPRTVQGEPQILTQDSGLGMVGAPRRPRGSQRLGQRLDGLAHPALAVLERSEKVEMAGHFCRRWPGLAAADRRQPPLQLGGRLVEAVECQE